MKNIRLLVCFPLFFAVSLQACYAQKLIQKESDIYKISQQDSLFIGKPLRVLLEQIKIPIKRVMAEPSKDIYSYVGNFRFNFLDNNSMEAAKSKGKKPIALTVLVKEYFEWDFTKRPKGKETVWTTEDVKKYGNLTVVGFRIY